MSGGLRSCTGYLDDGVHDGERWGWEMRRVGTDMQAKVDSDWRFWPDGRLRHFGCRLNVTRIARQSAIVTTNNHQELLFQS